MRRAISLLGLLALLLASCDTGTDEGQDAGPIASPEPLAIRASPPPIASVLTASVGWDGRVCRYVGPRRLVEDQRLRLRFRNRSDSESVVLVLNGFPGDADYGRFVAWSATHVVNFFGDFPPSRFLVPGRVQTLRPVTTIGRASIGPFPSGLYYLACLFWPADPRGGTMHPAALLEVVEHG